MATSDAGFLSGGLPYNRLGNNSRRLIAFQGLVSENKPLSGLMAKMLLVPFKPLSERYTVYVVGRRPNLPQGYSLSDMANDYSAMVRDEFEGGPVDVVGLSTGGSIAQVFAADHPEQVNRLVLYSSAYKLGEEGARFQRRLAELARRGRRSALMAEAMAFMFLPRKGLAKQLTRPVVWLMQLLTMPFRPKSVSDYVITVEAEDVLDFRSRLSEIRAPTLVIGGAKDPFYSPELFRETAEGIPNARLILYENRGHAPTGKRVAEDILGFLDAAQASES
jgi:pimeloyl-ACP methyl ester carboxylesterase